MSQTIVFTKTRPSLIDVAGLILRLTLGTVFVAHGSQKLFGAFGGFGIEGTGGFFESLGAAPGTFWAVVVGLVEFGGGIALALGLLTRPAAILIAVDMAVAALIYNFANGFFVETPTGGWEINLVLFAMCAAMALAGGGALSLDALVQRRAAWWRFL